MKSGNNKRTLVLLAVLGILLAFAYPMIMSETPSGENIQADNADTAEIVVDTLQKLQAVDLNYSVLENTAFAYLKDITTPDLNLPVGRDNPFAPTR
jgi:hypothetical protein